MNRDEYKALWRDLQAVRVRIYNELPAMTTEQRASLATDLEQALARLRGGEAHAPLGQRLHEWREAHGLSIADVAERLVLTFGAVQYLEDGNHGALSVEMTARIEALIATNPHV